MPKIGIAASATVMIPWLESLRMAADNGFDAFEITCVFPCCDLDAVSEEMKQEAREICADRGMEICVHAPFHDLNIASYNRGVRQEAIRQTKIAGLGPGFQEPP